MPANPENKRSDMRGHKVTTVERQKIQILAAAGESKKAIAKKVGRSTVAVSKVVDEGIDAGELPAADYTQEIEDYDFIISKSIQQLKRRVNTPGIKTAELVSVLKIASDQRDKLQARTTQPNQQPELGPGVGAAGQLIAAFAELTTERTVESPVRGRKDGSRILRPDIPVPPADEQDE